MGLVNAMAVLAEEWDDVLSHLDTGQTARLRGLVARFVDESDPDASSEISEAIMNLLLDALPVTHPVLSALMISEDRFRGQDSLAADSAWLQLAGPLRLRLGAVESPGGSATAGITVDIYLDTDDRVAAARVFAAADSLVRILGYDGPFDEEIVYGSIFRRANFRRAKAAAMEAATSQEMRERLIQVERIIELNILGSKQAAVDVQEAQAARMLIESIADIPQACLTLGSVLVVKYQDAGGPVLLSRNLSQLEVHALERFPEIQKNPRQVLDALATAVTFGGQGETKPGDR
jgi:hypothetical protein